MLRLSTAKPRLQSSQPNRYQGGISLIESLVAIVVTALGILGILGVQMRTLSDTSTTVRRAQAIRLIEDLGERMKTSPNALGNLSTYVSAFSDVPAVGSCASGCNPADLATHDLAVWKRAIRNTLPLGRASIFVPPAESAVVAGQGRQLGVMIAWRENERDTDATFKNDLDATKTRAADGTLNIGGGTDQLTNACPTDFTCHLQYIPVVGRCAPYSPGSNSTTYYCPGS